VPTDIAQAWDARARGAAAHAAWQARWEAYRAAFPAEAAELARRLAAGIGEEERGERRQRMAARFAFADYAAGLLALAQPRRPAVSVAVLTYNYARYLPERLGSVFAQTQLVAGVTVLDDASTDESVAVAERVAAEWEREIELVVNAANSGSVFAQWRRAAERASGEFLWIAEADDRAEPAFLARLLRLLQAEPEMDLAFCDSAAVDGEGAPIWPSYKEYYATLEPGALTHTEVFAAGDFVTRFLAVKNVILNVSAVLWRRRALWAALEACAAELGELRLAGDWRLYLQVLARPGACIGYEAEPLNVHRRHARSVTESLAARRHLDEIARCQGIAAAAFALPPPRRAAQAAYLAEVAKQFGCEPSAPAAGKPRRNSKRKT
jgi:hypothetical protein